MGERQRVRYGRILRTIHRPTKEPWCQATYWNWRTRGWTAGLRRCHCETNNKHWRRRWTNQWHSRYCVTARCDSRQWRYNYAGTVFQHQVWPSCKRVKSIQQQLSTHCTNVQSGSTLSDQHTSVRFTFTYLCPLTWAGAAYHHRATGCIRTTFWQFTFLVRWVESR